MQALNCITIRISDGVFELKCVHSDSEGSSSLRMYSYLMVVADIKGFPSFSNFIYNFFILALNQSETRGERIRRRTSRKEMHGLEMCA
jgi:hypothetical protein